MFSSSQGAALGIQCKSFLCRLITCILMSVYVYMCFSKPLWQAVFVYVSLYSFYMYIIALFNSCSFFHYIPFVLILLFSMYMCMGGAAMQIWITDLHKPPTGYSTNKPFCTFNCVYVFQVEPSLNRKMKVCRLFPSKYSPVHVVKPTKISNPPLPVLKAGHPV